MKRCRVPGMNNLRDRFETLDEIADVINRSRRYTIDRVNRKKEFTDREKRILCAHLGMEYSEDLFN